MKHLKVLHLLGELRFSGAEVQLNLAAPYLVNNEVDSQIISIGNQKGNYAQTLEKAGYKITHLRFKKSLSYFIKLHSYLKREKFDVIHIHAEQAFFYHVLIAKLAGIKTVIRTVRNAFTFKGNLRLRRMVQRFIASKIMKVTFVSVSRSVAAVEKKYFFNNCIHIPNWTNKNKVYPGTQKEKLKYRVSLHINPWATVLISIGACTTVKNHKAIIKAVSALKKDIPGIVYLHVGEGELQEEEKTYAKHMGVKDAVIFCGQTANIRKFLVASDVFVMPSSTEGFPMACVEAMMCRLPIIVYNNYGLKDLIENGVNGIAVENNLPELTAAIKKLASNKALRENMGQQSLLKISKEIDMKRSIRKYINLYRRSA